MKKKEISALKEPAQPLQPRRESIKVSCLHCGEDIFYWGFPDRGAAFLCAFCEITRGHEEEEPDTSTYQSYLLSDTWAALRRAALHRAKHRCQVCDSSLLLQVHHRRYPEFLGTEEPCDLVVLCRRCHRAFHGEK